MSNYVLLIDMDGVLCDWTGRLLTVYRMMYPDRPCPQFKDVKEFYLESHFPPEHREDVMKISGMPGFYSLLTPIEGAIDALKDMEQNCADFLTPFICSSPDVEWAGRTCHSEKAIWVSDLLGPFWSQRLILTKDKTLIRGHTLIDDKPIISGSMKPTWNQVVFRQPYNQEQTPPETQFTWKDWPVFRESIREMVQGTTAQEKTEPSRIILPR